EIASVKRKIFNLMGVNYSAHDGIFRLGGHGDRIDLDDFADRADLQLRVDARGLAYLERNSFQSTALEAGRLYRDRIAASRQEWNVELPRCARGDGADCVRSHIFNIHPGVRDDRAGSLGHLTD